MATWGGDDHGNLGKMQPFRILEGPPRPGIGVSSPLKDLDCGVSNEEKFPALLRDPNKGGLGKIMVDIGLRHGTETVAAVGAGSTVYSFEP